MLGAILFCSKLIMEAAPNIHLLGMLIMTYTVVYRKKALIPLYVFVILTGVYGGFAPWWVPYLYLWTVLWGVTMLLPKRMPRKVACVVYPLVCGLHGLAFGILYAPAQALMYGLSWEATKAWIVAGWLWADPMMAVGNTLAGLLIVPLANLMQTLIQRTYRRIG
jgi:energy-coupling factor transport system substrate-specific component